MLLNFSDKVSHEDWGGCEFGSWRKPLAAALVLGWVSNPMLSQKRDVSVWVGVGTSKLSVLKPIIFPITDTEREPGDSS